MVLVEIIRRGVLESFSWGTQKFLISLDISRFYCASASITRSLCCGFHIIKGSYLHLWKIRRYLAKHPVISLPISHSSIFSRPRRIFQPAETSHKLMPPISLHLLPLFRLSPHHLHTYILLLLLLPNPFKAWMSHKMLDHPVVEIFDVRNCIHDPSRPQDIGILRVKRCRDNPSFVFPGLEMRIWKAKENFGELTLCEEVWKELHSVGPQTCYILILASAHILVSHCPNLLLYELCD